MKHFSTSRKAMHIFRMTLFILLAGLTTTESQAQTNVTLIPGQTWTVPAGVTSATFYLWGGGGGGAGSGTSPACYNNGGGGGGGACASAVVTLVPGTVYTFTGGAGGASVAANATPAGSGGTTTFSGPAGTWTAVGGAGAAGTATGGGQNNAGGLGGTTGSGPGVTVRAGGDGSNAANGGAVANNCPQANRTGSGGGGGGSTGIGGTPINGCGGVGGIGGTGTFPGGDGGYNLSCGVPQVDAVGVAGAPYGGGGSGCMNWNGNPVIGGAGGEGRVVVSYTSSACSGIPTPGSALSTASAVCASEPFTLSLQNFTSGNGVTYQWRANTGAGYTNIAGATNSTHTTTQTVSTAYRCNVVCSGGSPGVSGAVTVATTPVGYPQTFAGSIFPPCGWIAANGTTYFFRNNASAFGIGNGSAELNFYDAPDGEVLLLTSETFPAVPSGTTLTFDFAYSAYDASFGLGILCNVNVDQLRIQYSTNGGGSFTLLDTYTGGTSAELNPFGLCNTGSYTPSAGDWSSKSVILPAGTNMIRFRALSGNGNNLFIDNINVNVPTPCSGAPSPGNTVASTNNQCNGTDVDLSLPNLGSATGYTYAWQTSPDNIAAYTNIAGATNAALTIQPSANGWYRCRVTCTGSGQSANSTPVQITVLTCINMIDGLTANACSGTFYDGGGSGGNYGNNNDRTTTICPSTAGSSVKVTFNSFDTEDAYDPLYIFNGPTNGSTLFSSGNGTSNTGFPAGGYWGTGLPGGAAGFVSTDPTGCLTFRFRSDGSVVESGWAATLSCVAPCSGMPTAGNTTVTAGSPFCASESFTLSIPGATVGGGITYQWQTSPDNINWTNATGAGNTSVTYTTTQNASTWYRCRVTCTGSGLTAPSAGLQVISDPDFTNCYCSSAPTSAIDEEIYRFFVNGIGTPSAYSGGTNGCNTPAPGPGSILNRYSNFKTLGPLASLIVGATSTFQVNENECDGAPFYDFGTAIWIDYNHNGSFADAGEKIFVENTTATGPRNIPGTFTVPATALPGITGLRVIVAESFSGASLTPCLSYGYGETEDFLVNIIPPNATSNSPVCEKDTIELFAPTTGVSYSWTTTAGNGFTSTVQNPIIVASNPSDAGVYTVVVNTGSGTYSASVTVVVNQEPALNASASAPFCEGTQNLNLIATAPTGVSYLWSGPGGYSSTSEDPIRTSTTAAMTGTYSVKVTDANGCTNTSTTGVTIYSLPPIDLIVIGSSHLCSGQQTTLLADGAGLTGSYLWSTTEIGDNITISAGGTYGVTGTDNNGCINTDAVVITESAPPADPIIVAMGDVNLCSSDGGGNYSSVILHTTNYSSDLFWSTGIDVTQDIVAYYIDNFNVTYTDGLGCSSTSNTISTIPNFTSTAPVNSQVSSDAPANITCAVPVTLTLADDTDPLGSGYLGTGAQWVWYDDAGCGANQVGTGTSIVITPSAIPGPHNYYVRAEGGPCGTSGCATITIIVKEPSLDPTSAVASLPTICEGDQTILSVSGGYLGTGANWVLYENTCGGAALQTSSSPSFTVTPQSPGLHTYFIRGEGDCNNTVCSMIQVDVKDSSAQAVSLSSSASDICLGSSVTLNINGGHLGRGAVWSFYESGCGNVAALQSGVSTSLILTPQSPGLYTYYVRAEGDCNTTMCMAVSVNVKAFSLDPTSASASVSSLCSGDQTILSVNGGTLGTGAQWKWYSGSCGGTLVGIGASVTVNTAATTTYYVRAEGDCNNSACASTTVTVNSLSTDPTSATSNAPVNGICIGGSVTLSVAGGSLGDNSTWEWYEDACGGTWIGSGSSINVTPAFEGLHSYYVRAEGPCNTTNCAAVSVLVGTYSVEATSITSSVAGNSICVGNNIILTLDGGFLGTVADWKWYSTSCGGAAVGTGVSITVNPTATTTYYVRAEGSCNTTSCVSITVFVSTGAPAQHANIIQSPQSICSGNMGTFTCQTVSNATYYSWSAPNGTTFNGNNPSPYVTTVPTVQVTFGALPNGVSGYDICVFAGNGCGTSVTKCKFINGRATTPQSITGNASSCPNTSSVYSCTSSPGANTYLWTITGNATFTNGNDSIVTNGTSTTVNFGSGWTSGLLSVFAQMSCGYQSPAKTISIVSTPVVPGVMSGPTLVCPLGTYVYSIAPVAGAVSYNWSTNVPGAILAGTGTSRSITFPAVIPAGSTVSVTATGSCGTSTPRVKNIATGMANTPGTITGPAMGQCGQTGVGYSILPVAGATSYFWSATNGATISGLNNITSVSIDFPAAFSTSSVSVTAVNGCGNSAAQTKLVTGAPGSPGAISGTGAVCLYDVQTYSVVGSTGATQYVWTSPSGSQIMSGQNSPSIDVYFFDNTGGNVSVYAANTCGISTTINLAVSVVCRLSQISQGALIDATLYPNPTIGTTTLKFETITAGDYKVSVVDITGQVMQTKNVTAVAGLNLHELDLSTYAKGLYMVRLEREGEGMQMLRVTVE